MAAATPEERIYEALAAHLVTLTDLPEVAWPGITYPAPGNDAAPTYLAVSYSPNSPVVVLIDPEAENIMRGVFGVSVMIPLGGGETVGQGLAGRIADHFQGEILEEGTTRVRVVSRPHSAGGYRDTDHWRIPVVIQYETVSV